MGSLGHFGEPWGLLQVMLVAAASVRKYPSSTYSPPPRRPLHNLMCTQPEHRICSIHTGICFNICPAILTHTEARVSSQSLLHLENVPSHLRPAPCRGIFSPPLPKAQATCFGAQLPGTHGISEQGAPLSLQLQGLCLQECALGLKGHANTTN